jgi:uncharacterized protein (DUF2345 family)
MALQKDIELEDGDVYVTDDKSYIHFHFKDGSIDIFSQNKINVNSKNDINIFSQKNINIEATENIKLKGARIDLN